MLEIATWLVFVLFYQLTLISTRVATLSSNGLESRSRTNKLTRFIVHKIAYNSFSENIILRVPLCFLFEYHPKLFPIPFYSLVFSLSRNSFQPNISTFSHAKVMQHRWAERSRSNGNTQSECNGKRADREKTESWKTRTVYDGWKTRGARRARKTIIARRARGNR